MIFNHVVVENYALIFTRISYGAIHIKSLRDFKYKY